MKTIKIIDLLNKIANGEEVPKKIKFDNKEYENEPCYMLYEATGERSKLHFKKFLNDEVEIIEEDKEIEKIITFYDDELEEYIAETKINNNRIKEHYDSPYEQMIINKINELIDKVNSLEKNE